MPKKSSPVDAAKKVAGSIDILWEILIRLPLKPLLRLKCVSKHWLRLISDQGFRDSHSLHRRKHQRYTTSLIFSKYVSPPHILDLTATTRGPCVLNLDFLNQCEATVVRSCNGLLLCRGDSASTYFVCNPITRDFTSVPLLRHPFQCKSKSVDLYLAFDPFISPHYKVISVAQLNSPLDWVFNVYSFKTTGSPITRGPTVLLSTPFVLNANGVYCNRAIHWCNKFSVFFDRAVDWCNKGGFCVYFDVDTQRLKNCPMPLSGSEWVNRHVHHFGESGGCLHLMLTIDLNDLNFNYDIFELKEDYSGWTLRHRVDLNFLQVEFPQITWRRHHLNPCIVRTAKSMLVLITGEEALLYDPVDQTSRKLCEIDTTISANIKISIALGGFLQYFENNESFVRF